MKLLQRISLVLGFMAASWIASPAAFAQQKEKPQYRKDTLRAMATLHNITLSWNAPVGGTVPTSYLILRGTSSGVESPIPIATIAAPLLTYADTSGVGGTTYFYQIEAFNGNASPTTSGPSNEVSATALPLTAPGTPTNVTISVQ